MSRHATIFLILSALLVLLATPATAQEGTATPAPSELAAPTQTSESSETTEPQIPAAPTAIPASDGPVVQAVFFFSPSCGHCEYVITSVLPGLFAENGGEYQVT